MDTADNYQSVVVFDLGGGTFDVSVIEIRDNVFEVVATDGDLFLGGINFDQIILNEILTTFHGEHGVDLTSESAHCSAYVISLSNQKLT